jgi:hypothetical protein
MIIECKPYLGLKCSIRDSHPKTKGRCKMAVKKREPEVQAAAQASPGCGDIIGLMRRFLAGVDAL